MMKLQEIQAITEKYRCEDQWRIAAFLARSLQSATFELFESSPALGFLLSHCESFVSSENPWEQAANMVDQPRRRIAGWLGFPQTKAAVRVVEKLDVRRISLNRCCLLRRLLIEKSTARLLSHLPIVCDEIVDVLYDSALRKIVTMPLLNELASRTDYSASIATDLQRILELSALHGAKVTRFRSCDAVEECLSTLQDMETAFLPHWKPAYERIDFPDPPISVPRFTLPNGLVMEPVRSPRELFQEAMEQKNCVFGFMKNIVAGHSAVYRILKPERATVMLRCHSHDAWIITQCRAARNRPVRNETMWLVGAYLSRRLERQAALDVMSEP